jgi:hypothetical protein
MSDENKTKGAEKDGELLATIDPNPGPTDGGLVKTKPPEGAVDGDTVGDPDGGGTALV